MKITKIDESAYLPKDAIMRLEKLGEFVQYNDRPSREEALQRLNDTDIAIVEYTIIDRDMLAHVEGLRYIVVPMTGYEIVHIKAAREHGIKVSNVPHYSRQSVAEHAMGMLLTLNRRIREADKAVREGKHDYFEPFLSEELYQKTLGIIGLGSIGSWVARIGHGFGMNVIGHSRTAKNLPNIKDASLKEVLEESDVVMLSVDLNNSTKGLLSKELLALMKATAYFISISHPSIYDDIMLANMLRRGRLLGVALDNPSKDSPLARIENTVLTPNIAWYTTDALDRLIDILIENIEKFIASEPQNLVT